MFFIELNQLVLTRIRDAILAPYRIDKNIKRADKDLLTRLETLSDLGYVIHTTPPRPTMVPVPDRMEAFWIQLPKSEVLVSVIHNLHLSGRCNEWVANLHLLCKGAAKDHTGALKRLLNKLQSLNVEMESKHVPILRPLMYLHSTDWPNNARIDVLLILMWIYSKELNGLTLSSTTPLHLHPELVDTTGYSRSYLQRLMYNVTATWGYVDMDGGYKVSKAGRRCIDALYAIMTQHMHGGITQSKTSDSDRFRDLLGIFWTGRVYCSYTPTLLYLFMCCQYIHRLKTWEEPDTNIRLPTPKASHEIAGSVKDTRKIAIRNGYVSDTGEVTEYGETVYNAMLKYFD